MKKILLAFTLVGLFTGCKSMSINNPNRETGVKIISNIMENQSFNLERRISGDGIKVGNKELNIHFKGTEGILEENGHEFPFNLY